MALFAAALAGILAVFFSGLMVFQRSLYASAVCLLAVLLQAAVLFFVAGAPLLAFLQIMIYAGAVMVLIVVAIMAAPSPPTGDLWSRLAIPWPLAVVGLSLPFLEIAFLLLRSNLPAGFAGGALPVQARIGPVLFGPYAVATEAVTLLLFLSALAIVGRESPE